MLVWIVFNPHPELRPNCQKIFAEAATVPQQLSTFLFKIIFDKHFNVLGCIYLKRLFAFRPGCLVFKFKVLGLNYMINQLYFYFYFSNV